MVFTAMMVIMAIAIFRNILFSNTRVNALGFEGRMLYLATGNGILKFDTQSYQYAETPA